MPNNSIKEISRWRKILAKLNQPLLPFGYHHRCLTVAAVILFTFAALNYFDWRAPEKQIAEEQALDATLTEEFSFLDQGQLTLNGLFSNFGNAAIPVAQANVDFSSDDELENQDFAMMEGSGLLSPEMAGNAFFGMQKEATTYIVQQGDSPFSIAIKFNINTYTVLAANNLREGDYIKPGQSLIILPINGVRVKVAAKDTIDSLAKKYKGKADEIKTFNGIYEDAKLMAGNFIIIPDGELTTTVLARPTVAAPKYSGATPASGSWLLAPTTGKDWGRLHGYNAVDVANTCGTPIYAAAAGIVTLSDGIGWNFGYGKYITIRHANGVVTVYGHASRLVVEQGQKVDQGQLIMLMGTTGRSTGCHLHFEVRGAKNPLTGAKTIK
ncbi:MAG: M23 family metallopeptidase [Patescibacteria group bacterium]